MLKRKDTYQVSYLTTFYFFLFYVFDLSGLIFNKFIPKLLVIWKFRHQHRHSNINIAFYNSNLPKLVLYIFSNILFSVKITYKLEASNIVKRGMKEMSSIKCPEFLKKLSCKSHTKKHL